MRLKTILVVGAMVVAAASVAGAEAGAPPLMHVSGSYTVDTKAKAKTACKPISKENQGVLRCTVSGFALDYTGSLQGRGVNVFKWIINCTTGKSYTDGIETFTGSIEGVGSGTLTWGVRSAGTFDCKKGEVTGVSAIQNLYAGSSALAGLYGSIHRGPATYSGVLSS